MRITLPGIALASLLLLVSSSSQSASVEPVNPEAEAYLAQGDSLLASGQGAGLDGAESAYEDALIIAPDSRAALMGLGRVAQAQGLPGKAIRYYRAVLARDPHDVDALERQGEALVAKGAFVRANDNLAKIKALCVSDCPQQVALGTIIARGTAAPPVKAAQVASKPVIDMGSPSQSE